MDTHTFVGRRRELEILERKLEEASTGRGNLVMLVGEAGIGKTWVAREFAERARRRGAVALSGCCFEGDWQPPYGPWAEAIREYVWLAEPERLRRELGLSASPLAQLVPQVRVVLPDTPVPPSLSPDDERVRLYDTVIHLLLAAAKEKPIVLVLDDLHWADRDSLQLLRHLGRVTGQGGLLIVGIYREPELGVNSQHPLTDVLAVLRREIDYQHMVVHGFSYEELAEYLGESLSQPLPEALAKDIYAETNGNPFYIREIARRLAEGKILRPAAHWSTGLSITELGIPQGVRLVVDRRISRLSDETKTLLKFAAAFTGGFRFAVLQALVGLSEEALLKALDEALEAGFIRVVTSAPPTYDFAHAIVRHTLYEELNPDRRARFHRRIAVALEQVYTPQRMEHAAELASQYYLSASLPGASNGVSYALAAAQQSRGSYAYEQAVGFLRMAREVAAESELEVKADVVCKLLVSEAEALMLEEAELSAHEVLAVLAEAHAEPRAQAEFFTVASRLLKDAGAGPAAWEPLVERGLALVGETRDLLWARLELLRDRYEVISAGPIYAVRWLGMDPQAVAIARTYGDEDDYARTLGPFEWRSREETDAVLKLIRNWKSPIAMMRALNVVTRDLLERHSAFREAVERFRELLELSERCGSIPGQAEALFQIAGTHVLLGEFALSQEAVRRARDIIARLAPEHRLHAVEPSLIVLLAYFLDTGWDRALGVATSIVQGATGDHHNAYALAAVAGSAAVYARTGKEAEARQLLATITPVAQNMQPTEFGPNGVVSWGASAVWDLGASEFASPYRRMALNLIEARVGGMPVGPNELAVARMASLLGDIAEAREYFDRARRIVDAMDMRHMRAIVDYDQALALLRSGKADSPEVLALLKDALATFRALGMKGWARRALDLQKQMRPPAGGRSPEQRVGPNALTRREVEVLRLVASGKTNREIAVQLTLSVKTVERHVANIYVKICSRGRADATAYAFTHGIVKVGEFHQHTHVRTAPSLESFPPRLTRKDTCLP